MHWIIKNDYVGSAFFDASASAFILPSLIARANKSQGNTNSTIRQRDSSKDSSEENSSKNESAKTSKGVVTEGYGLGPEWITQSTLKQLLAEQQQHTHGGRLQVN